MTRRKYLTPAPRAYKVAWPANSICNSALIGDLDFSRWFTDALLPGELYLHVPKTAPSEDSVHRVYCRHTDRPRLQWRDGTLYWLVDDAQRHAQAPAPPPMSTSTYQPLDILTEHQAAELLGCSVDTVVERTPHELPGVRLGRSGYRYVYRQLVEAVERLATPAAVAAAPAPSPLTHPPTSRTRRRAHPTLKAV